MTANRDQIRDQQRDTWDQFAVGWEKWDPTVAKWLAPVGAAMLHGADLDDRSLVLDVASGTGEPGLTAATLVPHGRVTLTDLSARMLAVASMHARHRGLGNVETQVCDAGALPFPDGSFDAVLCRFGFMFFPDASTAADEMARVTRPGGRVSAAVWAEPEQNPWATIIMGTIAQHVPIPAPPPDLPGLFRCASEGYLREVFVRAGIRDVSVEDVSCALVHDSPERYWQFMTDVAAPVVAGLVKADDATQDTIRSQVLDLAREHVREGGVQIGATARVAAGTR